MTTPRSDLPPDLVNAIRNNSAALFVGAGASRTAGLPSWEELVTQLANDLHYTLPDSPCNDILVKLPQYYENERGRPALMIKIQNILEQQAKLRPVHKHLANLPIDLYYTTNFDTFLEDELKKRRGKRPKVIANESMACQLSFLKGCQVRKIHGTVGGDGWNDGEWKDIVITRKDFARLPATRPVFFKTLETHLTQYVFLFVGYSLRDPDFIATYDNIHNLLQDKIRRHFLALTDKPEPLEIADLKLRGFEAIEVWKYPGDRTEKLTCFLESLVNATSDKIHLGRFYRRDKLKDQDTVSIVVGHSHNKTEGYMYYPCCDITVAHQVQADLAKISLTSNILPDVSALKILQKLCSESLILVGSPHGNKFTKYLFARDEIKRRFTFKKLSDGGRCLLALGKNYQAHDQVKGIGTAMSSLLSPAI